MDIHYAEDINSAITVNSIKYYESFKRVRSKEKTEIVIGKSLFITFFDKNQNVKIQFKPTNILKNALIDLSFILSVIENKQIEIDGKPLEFSKIQKTFTEEKIRTLRYNLEYCKWVAELFDRFGLDKNRDLSKMNSEDRRNTQRLIDALLEGKSVSGLRKNIPRVCLLNFMDTKLALVFTSTGNECEYFISDYFKDTSFELFHMEGRERYPTSKFVIMTADNFLEIGNIDYDEILNSFLRYADEDYCFGEANLILLEMIAAFDKSSDTRTDILDQAEKFAKVLITDIAKDKDKNIAQINFIQIEKRKHPLTVEQQNTLVAIAEGTALEDKKQDYAIRMGANLLLDNQQTAAYYYKKLDKNMQEQYKHYPIWRFWKEETGEQNNG